MITLQKISLILAMIGIFLLFISLSQEPPTKSISDLNLNNLGEKIKISGTITSQRNYDNFYILILKQNNLSIEATVNKLNQNLTNQNVEIIGKTELYNRKIQISIEKIYLN